MLLHQFLERAAARTAEAVALIEPSRLVSYDQMNRLANKFGNLYIESGVGRGDRVVIAVENSIEFVAAYFGAMKAGAVAVPVLAGSRSNRLRWALEDCAPRACILDASTVGTLEPTIQDIPVYVTATHGQAAFALPGKSRWLEDALHACSDEPPKVRCIDLDLAAIIYTSGSTGEPRGAMLTHRNLVANAHSIAQYLELASSDRVMCVLPFHYVYGLSLLHTHFAVGGSLVIDNRFAFPNVVLSAMRQQRVTGFAGVPATFALLMHRSNLAEVELPHLRYVTQAGGNMPPARILEWLSRGPKVPLYVMYGATEAGARLTYVPPARLREKLGSIGRAIPNVEITVLDENGSHAAAGVVGEIVARGSNISCGYWNNAAESAEKFGALGYRTGDLGYMDEDRYLYLVGRRADMIKVGAHRVGAKEIEDVLNEHPVVYEAAVVPAPHEILGEVPIAFVVLRSDIPDPARSLQAFCSSRLPGHKVPASIVVRTELPRIVGVGKIDKGSLRQLAPNVRLTDASNATRHSKPSVAS